MSAAAPAPAGAKPSDPMDVAREYEQAKNHFGQRVRLLLRTIIPRDPTFNVGLTVMIRGGNIRVQIVGDNQDREWKDSSR